MSNQEDFQYWVTSLEENIFWLRLNRLDKKNAFNPAVLDELGKILTEAKGNSEIRVMAISSTSDEFLSSGADIKWFMNVGENLGIEASRRIQEVFGMLEELPYPVIFATKGLNLTAGFELMLASDIVIAADNSKLGQIETRWALTPGGGGTQRLTRHVGVLKAKEIIYTAKIFDAKEAKEIGLVNHVVPVDQLDEKVRAIAQKIIAKTPNAIRDAKYLLNKSFYPAYEGFKEEQKIFGKRFGSGEPRQLFKDFVKKNE